MSDDKDIRKKVIKGFQEGKNKGQVDTKFYTGNVVGIDVTEDDFYVENYRMDLAIANKKAKPFCFNDSKMKK